MIKTSELKPCHPEGQPTNNPTSGTVSKESSRQQFESRYPVPDGIHWDQSIGTYRITDINKPRNQGAIIARYEAYVHSWGVWKASREDAVTAVGITDDLLNSAYWDFDARVKGYPPYQAPAGQECSAFKVAITAAIESAGLRVSP